MEKKTGKWMQRIKDTLQKNSFETGKPLVEIWGRNRVLIENHNRVLLYTSQKICVKVAYGEICITGSDLLFARLSGEQLVITGCVESVLLTGGCGKCS